MKKIISVLLILSCVLCLFCACGEKKITSGDYVYTVQKDGTAKIVKYVGTEDKISLELPDELDGKKVTVIGKGAFKNVMCLTVVNGPKDLVAIEEKAFEGSSVKKVFFFKCHSLTVIGDSAFAGCEKLIQADMPSSLEKLGANAFSGDAALKIAEFRGNTADIGAGAFSGCEKVTVYFRESADSVKKFVEANGLNSKTV